MSFRRFGDSPLSEAGGMSRASQFLLVKAAPSGTPAPVVTYTLKDEYSAVLAAGSVNGTLATDGVNARTAVDSALKMPITANGLEIQASAGAGDPGIWYPGQSLAIGIAVAWRIKVVSGSPNFTAGWDNNQAGDNREGVHFVAGGVLRAYYQGNQRDILTGLYSTGVFYDCVAIKRNPGVWIIIRGGAFTDWKLAFVYASGADATTFPSLTGAGAVAFVNYAQRVYGARLQQWLTQYANVSARTAISANSDTIAAASGDAIIEHTITAATGVTQELMVRRTDDSNCIIIRMDQTNSTIRVYEKNAGVESELVGGSTAQTWTNGSTFRVMVSLFGNSILVTVGGSGRNSVTSTGFNASVTGVKVSHAGTDLIAWPIALTGAVKAELDAFFP